MYINIHKLRAASCVYIYIYIYIHTHTHIYIYIIYIICIICTYIYLCIYIHNMHGKLDEESPLWHHTFVLCFHSMYTYMHIIYSCMCIYVYMYTYMHIIYAFAAGADMDNMHRVLDEVPPYSVRASAWGLARLWQVLSGHI